MLPDDPALSQPEPEMGLSAPSLGGLPLPVDAPLAFWRGEVDRAEEAAKPYHGEWQDNVSWYIGKSPDAQTAVSKNTDYVNVNVDFYQVEQKQAQLFYETPELQMHGTGILEGRDDIVQAHRLLMDEILGDSHADVLTTVHDTIKSCLCVENTGPVLIGYQPTLREVTPPMMPGSILGLNGPVSVPIHEQWYALPFSRRKLLVPADFKSTNWDKAPWLGMRFRMPLAVAIREKLVPPDFKGTNTRDEFVLEKSDMSREVSGLNYVDGQALWYKASMFDAQASHPELYRELILIDGLEKEARHRDSPHQTMGPDGRMTGDSMRGNPIHPLTIRSVPDSSFVPSDSQMTRPLVRELCSFRTQMVQERDATRPRWGFDSDKLTPESAQKLVDGTLGAMIPLEGGALAQGVQTIIAQLVQSSPNRQTYVANDYITHDIEKTLAIDSTGAGVTENDNESATKTATVDRNRSTRLDAERRQVLKWYLKLVDKMSALVCRYMTPQMAAQYIGQQRAAVWAQWDKKSSDGRLAFSAKPDSQIRLDAAQERKFALQLYQMVANDPNVVRVELLKNLFIKSGYDPAKVVVDQVPDKGPEEKFTFSFKGEDFVAPQAAIVLEILAKGGIQISQQAHDEAAGQMFKQVALGLRDASGKPMPTATSRPKEHGGPTEQVRPLSKRIGDETGNRPGPSMETPQ